MDIHEFVATFLVDDSLRRIMNYLCESSVGQASDPIVDVVSMMISTPVSPVFTEVGVAPFKDRLVHVFPYTEMSIQQREFIKEVIRSATLSMSSNGKGSGVSVSLQVGGGCILQSSCAQRVFLRAENVLATLCRSVFSSRQHTDNVIRRNICNIIIQRVSGAIHIHQNIINRVGAIVESLPDG